MSKHLNDFTIDGLRLAVPTWRVSTLKELAAKIRNTLLKYSKKMPDKECNLMQRKLTIVRNEIYRQMAATGVSKHENHRMQEKFINGAIEEPFKLRKYE